MATVRLSSGKVLSVLSGVHEQKQHAVEVKQLPYQNFIPSLNNIVTSYLTIPDILLLGKSKIPEAARSAKHVIEQQNKDDIQLKKSFLFIAEYFQEPLVEGSEHKHYHILMRKNFEKLKRLINDYDAGVEGTDCSILVESLYHIYQYFLVYSDFNLDRYLLHLVVSASNKMKAVLLVNIANFFDQKAYRHVSRDEVITINEMLPRIYENYFIQSYDDFYFKTCSVVPLLAGYEYALKAERLIYGVDNLLSAIKWAARYPEEEDFLNALITAQFKKSSSLDFLLEIIDDYMKKIRNEPEIFEKAFDRIYRDVLKHVNNNVKYIPYDVKEKIRDFEFTCKIFTARDLKECENLNKIIKRDVYESVLPGFCFSSQRIKRYSCDAVNFIELLQCKVVDLISKVSNAEERMKLSAYYLQEGVIFCQADFKMGVMRYYYNRLREEVVAAQNNRSLRLR